MTEPNYCVAPMCVQLCRQIRDLKSIYFNLILRYFYYADIVSADDVYLWLRPNGWVGWEDKGRQYPELCRHVNVWNVSSDHLHPSRLHHTLLFHSLPSNIHQNLLLHSPPSNIQHILLLHFPQPTLLLHSPPFNIQHTLILPCGRLHSF